jgi:hypothetical protein
MKCNLTFWPPLGPLSFIWITWKLFWSWTFQICHSMETVNEQRIFQYKVEFFLFSFNSFLKWPYMCFVLRVSFRRHFVEEINWLKNGLISCCCCCHWWGRKTFPWTSCHVACSNQKGFAIFYFSLSFFISFPSLFLSFSLLIHIISFPSLFLSFSLLIHIISCPSLSLSFSLSVHIISFASLIYSFFLFLFHSFFFFVYFLSFQIYFYWSFSLTILKSPYWFLLTLFFCLSHIWQCFHYILKTEYFYKYLYLYL